MSKNYISPSMIPMDAVAQYMEKVCKFGKKTDASKDTENVAEIKSSLIAKAATDENGELVADRETVKNALSLGGVPASKYVTSEGASALLSDTYTVSTNMGDEVKNLRDELYQMKSELAKLGMIKNTDCYNGFIDPFKIGDEKYIKDIITVTATDLSNVQIGYISVDDATEFSAGEYIVVGTTVPQIVQIEDKIGNRLNLKTNIAGPIPSSTPIYKTYGTYQNGSFVFGQPTEVAIASQEKYIVLNDDAQPILLTKKYVPNSGYAAQINIPSTAKGAVRKVGVQAKVTGFPGGLKCYVIDHSNNTNDMLSMTTIEELKADGKIIGESNLIYPSSATGAFNEMYFEFNTPVILNKSNYVFLFVQIDADINNYWELKGLRGQTNMDLQTNSKMYSYADGVGFSAEDGDLYLIVVTSEVLLDTLQFSKQGLYSSKFELTNTKATRVRVELKINKEGRFKVVDNPNTLVPNVSRPLNTFNEDNKSYAVNLFNTGDLIVIGNQIANVGNARTSNNSFNLSKEVYAPAGAEVYRVGYTVQAKAIKKKYDLLNTIDPIVKEDTVIVNLPLVAIIPGKESGKEDISSDRLIFEADLKVDELTEYKLESFNEIEIQVFWENKAATQIDLNNSPELAGKILDITVSTDSTYNVKK